VVVGVGGFLSIGAKNVAIDMNAFDIMPVNTGTSDRDNGAAGSADGPTRVKLKVSWTKDQLQEAADFQYFKPAAPTTTGSAPRPRPVTAPPSQKE
jgi:hypothetical protein